MNLQPFDVMMTVEIPLNRMESILQLEIFSEFSRETDSHFQGQEETWSQAMC